jgi:LPS export ABC transporter protein LptC
MPSLARAFLVAAGVFVLVVAVTLAIRAHGVRVEPAVNASQADLQMKDVDIREESGKVRWHLTAEQASVFEGEGRTSLRRIAVRVEQPERSWTMVGDEGDFHKQSNDVELRRNVVVTSSDGLRLETSVLRWTGGQQRLWTDAPVRITRPGTTIDGTAFDVTLADEHATVSGPVRASFTRGEPR